MSFSLPIRPLNGRFADLHLIGVGGSASVFSALDLTTQQRVAVKILRPELTTLRGRARFDREIKIIRSLRHPNVLPLIDVGTIEEGQFGGCPFFVMPLVNGESLRTAIERQRQFSVAEAVRVIRGIATGLAAAHGLGVVHRDVKPENVLVEGDRVLVADFGIARLSGGERGMTSSTGVIVGTPVYMSPEQISGDRDLDQRSDIYSLGILFYELLAGNPPFAGTSTQAISARHLLEPPPPLRVVRPDVDRRLAAVLERALAKVPAARQADCHTFLLELDRALAPVEPQRRRKRIAQVMTGLGVAVVATWIAKSVVPVTTTQTLDVNRVLLLPFERSDDAQNPEVEDRVKRALREWSGLEIADNTTLDAASTEADATHRGRQAGAGLVIYGRLAQRNDSVYLFATLRQIADPPTVRHAEMFWASSSTPPDSAFRSLSAGLLVPETAHGVRSKNYPAVTAFSVGLSALREWNLEAAEIAFDRAVRADVGITPAMLWLALTRAWLERPTPEWTYLLVRARAMASGHISALGADSAKLTALSALAAGDLLSACKIWRRYTVVAPGDFANWYGLADCLRRDLVVVPDRAAATGWRFRSSHAEALAAYRRALELLPASHRALSTRSFERVRRFMLTSMTDFVVGHNESRSLQFAGLPSIDTDSLVLQPISMADFQSGRADALPASHRLAVVYQRRVFDSLTATWASAFPESSDALLARAISLELLGNERMLNTIVDARKRARTSNGALDAGVAHVRMLVKHGLQTREFMKNAKALADSLVARYQADTAADQNAVAALAALTGRVPLAASIIRRQTSAGAVSRSAVDIEGAVLLLWAASGNKDSVAAQSQRVEAMIEQLEPAQRTPMRMSWIARAATLAFPDTIPPEARVLRGNGDYLLDAQLDVEIGERQRAVNRLTSIAAGRMAPPADLPLDALCPEMKTLAAAGATEAALRWITGTLTSLAVASPDFLVDVTAAAVLARCIESAAILLRTAGESRVADQWQSAARLLTGRG